jgi:hypothetical protein
MWSRYFPIFAIITGNDERHMQHGLADMLSNHNPYDSISTLRMENFYPRMRESCIDMNKGTIVPDIMESLMDVILPEPYGHHNPIMTFRNDEYIDFTESIIIQFMVMNMMSDGTSFDDAIKDIHTFLDTTRTGAYVLHKDLCCISVFELSPFAIRSIINDHRIDDDIYDLIFNDRLYNNHSSRVFQYGAVDAYIVECMRSRHIQIHDFMNAIDRLEDYGQFADIIEDQKNDVLYLAQYNLSENVIDVRLTQAYLLSYLLLYRILCQYDDDYHRITMTKDCLHDVVNAYNEGLPVDFIANAWFEKVDEDE